MFSQVILILASFASSVLAHGYVQELLVASPPAKYTPWLPNQDNYTPTVPERVGRKIPSDGPVEDVTSIDIQCNQGANPAALVATAEAGSVVTLNWTDWPKSHIGPVITYLAKAPSDITKWSPGTDKVWFKIHEAGLENGKWAATDILPSPKSLWPVMIPKDLKPGQYLMRHEIIALHGAGTYPGAQFYPVCIQFEITGSGTALPNDSDLVAFPGAYAGADPGITFNPYVNAPSYKIPGPPVWGGSGSGSGSGNSTSSYGSGSGSSADSGSDLGNSTSSYDAGSGSGSGSGSDNSKYGSIPPAAAASNSATTTEAASKASDYPSSNALPTTDGATTTKPAYAPVKTDVSDSASNSTLCPPNASGNANGSAHLYAQCGGAGFDGPKSCVSPYTCKSWNPYYSQCV